MNVRLAIDVLFAKANTIACFTIPTNLIVKLIRLPRILDLPKITPPQPVEFESPQEPVKQPVQTYTDTITGTVLLATAQIIIEDQIGNLLTVRALVDPAAERSFIIE